LYNKYQVILILAVAMKPDGTFELLRYICYKDLKKKFLAIYELDMFTVNI